MIRRIGTGLVCAAALAIALGPAHSAAEEVAETESANILGQLDEQRARTRTLSHKMMGHINLAELAMDVEMGEEALDHVRKAKKIAAQLEASAPQVQSVTQYKYGKLSYKFEDETRHYYVPVVDDVYLLSDYRETHRAFGDADVEELDAGVMEVTISADLREVSSALARAESKLVADDEAGARVALAGVFRNAITDEQVVSDPIWAIHDNLSLARNFIADGNYESARMALEHAKNRLAGLTPAKGTEEGNESELEDLDREITSIQATLKKNDPSLRERVVDRLSSWMETVGTWYEATEAGSPKS